MKRILPMTGVLALLCAPMAYALEGVSANPGQNTAPPAQMKTSGAAYLGVAIDTLPPAVAKQLPADVANGEGVIVMNVAPDSPAAKAGIQPYDILVSYGDQKLYSPEQLTKLVRNDQAGKRVPIKVVRAGKVMEIDVTLGRLPGRLSQREIGGPYQRHPYPRFTPHWGEQRPYSMPPRPKRFIETFEALSINKTADGKYKVVVEYLSDKGVKKHHEFQGTRDEINRLIRQEKDLPQALKQRLLQALNNRGPMFMPPDFMMPFEQPFFDRFFQGEEWPDRF